MKRRVPLGDQHLLAFPQPINFGYQGFDLFGHCLVFGFEQAVSRNHFIPVRKERFALRTGIEFGFFGHSSQPPIVLEFERVQCRFLHRRPNRDRCATGRKHVIERDALAGPQN